MFQELTRTKLTLFPLSFSLQRTIPVSLSDVRTRNKEIRSRNERELRNQCRFEKCRIWGAKWMWHDEEGSIVHMCHRRKVSANLLPTFPLPSYLLENQRFHSLGCSSDLYVRARHGVSTSLSLIRVGGVMRVTCVYIASNKKWMREREREKGAPRFTLFHRMKRNSCRRIN